MSAIDHLRDTLRKLCTELENMSIINDAYWDLIAHTGIASHDDLKRLANQALDDPDKRKQAHEQFAEMWAALEKCGTDVWYEELLKDLPPSGKPN
jgi:hypothetical protein